MTSKVLESCENRQGSKLAMYCERLSERPRLLKHALISTASDIPDNQFKSRKVTAVRKSLCFRSTIDEKGQLSVMISQNNGTEALRKALEQEFMKRLGGIEDAPEEVKFPVLRASHPGGQVFRTQKLGVVNKQLLEHRHPFNLADPNAPAPEYSCYYDKHLKTFFEKPAIRRKLIEQCVITADEHYIREPYKTFKEYIRRKKLPYGSNPIAPINSEGKPKDKPKVVDMFADEDIKQFVESKFNVESALVDEMYSGRRRGSVIPLTHTGQKKKNIEENKKENKEALPDPPMARCTTPQKLAIQERDLTDNLHHSRINVVAARRQMLELQKKGQVIEQGLIKQKKLRNNKTQIELDRWEASMNKMVTTFDRKKSSIFNRLKAIEEDKLTRKEVKDKAANKLKKKFAAFFIKKGIAERKIRERRQAIENNTQARNNAWLQKQRVEREQYLLKVNRKIHKKYVAQLDEITCDKTSKIAQLQLKSEYYNKNLQDVTEQSKAVEAKLSRLQKEVSKNV